MDVRKRVFGIVLSVLLIVASFPALMIPAEATGFSALSVTASGQSDVLPLDSTEYYSAAQAIYTADELGGMPFTVQAMTLNVEGAPEYGIWRSFEIYMVSVPAGAGFEDGFGWYELTAEDAVLFGSVQLFEGENVIPFRYSFEYDGESDVVLCIVSGDGTVTDERALFGTREGASLVYNGQWFADVLDAGAMAENEGVVIGEIPAVTFLANYDRAVNVTESVGGTVEADCESAEAGSVITLTATPDDGFEFMGYRVYTPDGEKIEVTDGQFEMPTADVYVIGYFRNIMDGSCWFRYGTGDMESSTGLGEDTMIWEIMVPADDIAMMGYNRLTAVGFYFVEEFAGDYWITVYLDGEAVYTTCCQLDGESRWADVELDEVIELDGTQDVEIEVYTEGFAAPAAFSADAGVPYARYIWNDYYGGLLDMYDMGMPVTWLIHAQFGWDLPSHTVTLHKNDGTAAVAAADPAFVQTPYAQPACPFTCEGKDFAGWSLTPGGAAVSFPVVFEEDTDLYAIWTTHPCTVTYNANNGLGQTKTVTVDFGTSLTLPACSFTAPAGMCFAGWALTPNGAKLPDTDGYSVNGDVTFYALWKPVEYTVTFDANGGTGTMTAATAEAGKAMTLPACGFTAPQYKQFAGWALAKGGATLGTSYTFTKNTTLYAIWKPVPCKVVYDLNGGTGTPVSVTLDAGTKLILPACSYTAPANKHFAGWSLTPNGAALPSDYVVTGDVTFFALWATTTYEITFNADGGTGTMKAATAEAGKAMTLPACGFTAPQYKQFAGWSLTKNGALLGANYTFTKDTTVYAVWKAIPATVTFNAGKGTGTMAAVTVNLGDEYTLPACGFTAPEYGTFLGWSLTADGELLTDALTIKGNVTLFAIWEINIPTPTYTVSFNANGGTGEMTAVVLDENTVYTLPACGFTAPEYGTFLGWSLTPNGAALPSDYVVTGDVTFFALWATTTYEITFNADGGTGTMKAATAEAGKAMTLPACGFTAPQYKQFAGWSLTKNGALLGANYTFTKDTTVYAVWKAIPATVTFNAGKGTGTMTAVTVNLGDEYTLPACGFTAPEYGTFLGWSLTADGELLTDALTIKGNVTLFAIWEINVPTPTYTVSFNANGGSGEMKAVVVDENTVYTLPACGFTAPDHYRFAGWSTASQGEVLTQNPTITENTTLFAVWEAITFTVTFDPDGGTGTMAEGTAVSGEPFLLPGCLFEAPENMAFAGWSLTKNGALLGASYTFTKDTTVFAVWKAVPAVVTFNANGGSGDMAPIPTVVGTTITLPACGFTAPNEDKLFAGWAIGSAAGDVVPANGNLTVSADTVLYAIWIAQSDAPTKWAIRTGLIPEDGVYNPEASLVYSEFVYRLWVVNGSPAAKNRTMRFKDVDEQAYYYEAVLWALEKGYISMPAEGTMNPGRVMTRVQIISILYAVAGTPYTGREVHFTDTYVGAYYIKALDWAVDSGIVLDPENGSFGPHTKARMSEILMWLYRYYNP